MANKKKKEYVPKSDYEKAKEKYGLTYKQYAFANHYITSGNGLKSARNAGYKGSDNTVSTMACTNLKLASVKQYIDDTRHYLNQKTATKPTKPNNNINNNCNGESNDINIHNLGICGNDFNDTIGGVEKIIQCYWDIVQNTPTDAVRRAALADLSKIYGVFAPQKMEIETNQSISLELENARKRLEKTQHED